MVLAKSGGRQPKPLSHPTYDEDNNRPKTMIFGPATIVEPVFVTSSSKTDSSSSSSSWLRVDSCCCCVGLSSGSRSISVLGLLSSLAVILSSQGTRFGVEATLLFTFLSFLSIVLFVAVFFRWTWLLLVWLLVTSIQILGFVFVSILAVYFCVNAIGVYPSVRAAENAYEYMNWLVILAGCSFFAAGRLKIHSFPRSAVQ